MKLTKLIPLIAGLLALLAVLLGALPANSVRGFDVDGFGRLPVLEGGRVKPLDSLARNSLLVLRSQQSFRFQERTLSADEWLLDVLFRPQVADTQPVFVINDPDVLGLLGQKQSANRYFSFEVLLPHLEDVERQAMAAEALKPGERTRFQRAVLNLYNQAVLYHRLKNSIQAMNSPGLIWDLERLSMDEAPKFHESIAGLALFRPLPPRGTRGFWLNTGEALAEARRGSEHPGLRPLAALGNAYANGDAIAFNQSLERFRSATDSGFQPHADAEMIFNRVQPFAQGMVLYILALLVLFLSWAWKPELLRPTAFSLLLAGAAVHTAGLACRILLQGRPPVTNLYSSAVFVGWGVVLLGIILEWIYRRGFGTAVSAAIGFGSLLVAQALSADGDTMTMMSAVLDSNFWLATHVVTITIGYSGTFVAGSIAMAYALRKRIAKTPEPQLVFMVYGVICFSLFFSFVGTVLGGIWADQSWGRFWGWDPKENGALMIVLWNAIILHARWGGFVKERGIMTMAIFGNIITSLSWFGVNMLGVGLHSYGFMDKAFWWLSVFILFQLLFMGLSLLPPRQMKPQA